MSTSTSKTKNRRDFSTSVVSSVGILSETEPVKEAAPSHEEPASQVTEEVTVVKTKERKKSQDTDGLDQILAMTGKNKRGQQKSVYFDSDVFEFIQEKSQKNGVPFSFVLNLILKDYIKKMG